jgi:hypothetical protein
LPKIISNIRERIVKTRKIGRLEERKMEQITNEWKGAWGKPKIIKQGSNPQVGLKYGADAEF